MPALPQSRRGAPIRCIRVPAGTRYKKVQALPIVSLVNPTKDGAPTLVGVEVEGDDSDFAVALALHEWWPIVVGDVAC